MLLSLALTFDLREKLQNLIAARRQKFRVLRQAGTPPILRRRNALPPRKSLTLPVWQKGEKLGYSFSKNLHL